MSGDINRRAILAGAVSAAVAVPAVGAPALEPEPIFAAIENYKKSDAAWFARARN